MIFSQSKHIFLTTRSFNTLESVMSMKLNQAALKQYSADFTSKILDDFYASKSVISGHELLSLTPSRQVNLGIISRLFEQWQADAQAFRSPYFDFEKEEVVNAMKAFMNTVSQYIAIKREDLESLLVKSTSDAIRLLLDPEEYFDGQLRTLPNFVFDSDAAQKLIKYTHIHSGVAKALALCLTDSGSEYVYVNQTLNWLLSIVKEGTSLDDQTPFVDEFSSVLPLDVASIVPSLAPPADSDSSEAGKKSFFDTALDSYTDTESAPARPNQPESKPKFYPVNPESPQPSAPPQAVPPVQETPTPPPAPSVQPEPMYRPPQPMFSDSKTPATPPVSTSVGNNTLNSRFKVDLPEQSEESKYGSVQVKVDSILSSIALGQRFMFVNQLFNKSSDAFDEAIRELDTAATFDEARDLLSYKFASKYFWDMSSDAVNDLMATVKRKFN